MQRLFVERVPKAPEVMASLSPAEQEAETLRNMWDDRLKKITGKQDWLTASPATKTSLAAEMQALLMAHRTGRWDVLGDLWMSKLLPVHELVMELPAKVAFFVLATFDRAALAWPAKRMSARSSWTFDLEARPGKPIS